MSTATESNRALIWADGFLIEIARDRRLPIEVRCRIPDDYIDARRYPLLAAREVMRQVVDDLLGRSTFAPGALA